MTSIRFSELRLGDLFTFLAVRRSGSITAAARELRVTPSQVSKAITRLEGILSMQLLSRSPRGVALSEAGRRMVPHMEMAVASLKALEQGEPSHRPELTVAAPSYLIHTFLPVIINPTKAFA
jgi:DNA-binding transcriptional LysR family regulator